MFHLEVSQLHPLSANFFYIKYNIRGLKVSGVCVNLQALCLSSLVMNSFPVWFVNGFIGEQHLYFPFIPESQNFALNTLLAQMQPWCPSACLNLGFHGLCKCTLGVVLLGSVTVSGVAYHCLFCFSFGQEVKTLKFRAVFFF